MIVREGQATPRADSLEGGFFRSPFLTQTINDSEILTFGSSTGAFSTGLFQIGPAGLIEVAISGDSEYQHFGFEFRGLPS